MLVTLASLLNYSMDKSVAIVDCDSTQRSLFNLRERDMEMVEKTRSTWCCWKSRGVRGCRILSYQAGKAGECTPGAGELAAKADF